jgi:hypothetical protein
LHAFSQEGHAMRIEQNSFLAVKKHKESPHVLIMGNKLIFSERQESLSGLSQTLKMGRSQGNFSSKTSDDGIGSQEQNRQGTDDDSFICKNGTLYIWQQRTMIA